MSLLLKLLLEFIYVHGSHTLPPICTTVLFWTGSNIQRTSSINKQAGKIEKAKESATLKLAF